jgi:predicted ATP-grasp superfamily ATP-dependent carboligase
MSVRRIVVLGSSETALAVVRDAHAHGVEAIVLDTRQGIAHASRRASGEVFPASGSAAMMRRAIEIAGGECGLIASGDDGLRLIQRHWLPLSEAYGRIFHPSPAGLAICLSKAGFARWCRQEGLPAPHSWLVDEEPRPEALPFPLLLRPAETVHDRPDLGLPKAVSVANEAELAGWLVRFRERSCPVVASQRLHDGELIEYSVPFARNGATIESFVARKIRPTPQACSVGTCVELAPHEAVERLARQAIERLDYFGIGEVEILHDESANRSYLIEINARPWLQYPLAPASGHDFLGLLLDPSRRRDGGHVKQGKRWIDFEADLFVCFSKQGLVRTGQIRLLDYLWSVCGANVFSRFDWKDPMPFLSRAFQFASTNLTKRFIRSRPEDPGGSSERPGNVA